MLDVSMPGYVTKQLLKYEHIMQRVQHCPYATEPKKYATKAQSPLSQACSHFFMDFVPRDGKPIKLNGAFHVLCSILRCVVASAAEAELGALFMNCQEGMIFKATLEDLGHPQPPIPVHCNNATAVGIANNTFKCQRSQAMEMKYFWTYEKEAQKVILFKWHPGMETLADY
jgi:hypothetical protein